jgi:hypothetical protein
MNILTFNSYYIHLMQTQTQTQVSRNKFQTLVSFPMTNGETTRLMVEPLSQEDIAAGWNLVTPHKTDDGTIFHFSVYLSQLPSQLWSKLRYAVNEEDVQIDEYRTIKDKIYYYSVKYSKSDYYAKQLYQLVMTEYNYANKSKIADLVHKLEKQNVKGWLMIKARSMLV